MNPLGFCILFTNYSQKQKAYPIRDMPFVFAEIEFNRARPRPVGDKGSARSGSNLGCDEQAPPCEVRALVATVIKSLLRRQVMTTSRAGDLHKPPWGISHAEPIGSSNNPPLAEVAPPPQMWQSLKNCLPQWGKVAAVG